MPWRRSPVMKSRLTHQYRDDLPNPSDRLINGAIDVRRYCAGDTEKTYTRSRTPASSALEAPRGLAMSALS